MIKQNDIYIGRYGRKRKVVYVFHDGSFFESDDLDKDYSYVGPDEDERCVYFEDGWHIGLGEASDYYPDRGQEKTVPEGYTPIQNEKLPAAPSKYEGQEGAKGLKYDNGKLIGNILFEYFPNALKEVVEIATYGANKYERSSWLTVPNAIERYSDAMVRHQLEMGIHGELSVDEESGLLHMGHFVWNALAVLELHLRDK